MNIDHMYISIYIYIYIYSAAYIYIYILHCKHDYKPKASKLVVMSETAERAILVDQKRPQYINLKLAPRNSSHPIIK